MRLITFLRGTEQRLGAWIDDDKNVVDLALAASLLHGKLQPAFISMQSLIEAGEAASERARSIIERPPEEARFGMSDCKLLAPLPMPVQIRDFLCFPGHLAGAARVIGEALIKSSPEPEKKRAELETAGFFDVPRSYFDHPLYYICNRTAVVGPDVDVMWPAYSNYIDYELEWAAVIGKGGTRLSKQNARENIFGYTIFNDWSARDEQRKAMGGALNIGPGQSKDFANGLGPCIVTSDEIKDPYTLCMKARINGVEVSSGSTSEMHYHFEDLIEYLTRAHSLLPGEVIGSGTVGGGCSFETGNIIVPGDVVELEVQRIGILRNKILSPRPTTNWGGQQDLGSWRDVLRR